MYRIETPQLWDDDAIVLEVRFSYYHGWEWTIRARERGKWAIIDSGLEKSTGSALVRAAQQLTELAHTYR